MRYLILFLLLAAPAAASPGDNVYSFTVIKVIDGDTFRVNIPIWVGQIVTTKIRIMGVDTAEMGGKCAQDKAQAARQFTARWLKTKKGLRLTDIREGRYKDRVLARVINAKGESLGDRLLAEKLARRYRRSGNNWCK